jgi:hypothetical protein
VSARAILRVIFSAHYWPIIGPLLMVMEKSFPLSALYCDSGKRYRFLVI